MDIQVLNGRPIAEDNIFIGISVGIKPLTPEIAREYLRWCLHSTKGSVAVLIADEIAKYNYEVFSRYSERKALDRALRDGARHAAIFDEAIREGFSSYASRITIVFWKDIVDQQYLRVHNALQDLFSEDADFRSSLLHFIDMYIGRKQKERTYEERLYLCNYLLAELPTLLDGIRIENKRYSVLFYPTYVHSGMSELATAIQSGLRFPFLKQSLQLAGDTVLVEAYLPGEGGAKAHHAPDEGS